MQDLAHLTEVACACNCRRIGPTGYSNAVVPPVTSGRAFACSQHVCAEACRGEAMVSVPVNHKTSCKVSREYRQLQCSICSHFCSNYNAHCPHVQFYRPCRCTSSFQSTSALSWQLQHIDCTGCMLACFHFPCYTARDTLWSLLHVRHPVALAAYVTLHTYWCLSNQRSPHESRYPVQQLHCMRQSLDSAEPAQAFRHLPLNGADTSASNACNHCNAAGVLLCCNKLIQYGHVQGLGHQRRAQLAFPFCLHLAARQARHCQCSLAQLSCTEVLRDEIQSFLTHVPGTYSPTRIEALPS